MALFCPPGKGKAGLATGSRLFGNLEWLMPLAKRPQDLALMLLTGSKAAWLGAVDRQDQTQAENGCGG